MCGICGFSLYGRPDTQAEAAVAAMLRPLHHRGPDDEGRFVDGATALAVKRLSVIDLRTGHQPVHSEDKRLWVVCNGEIYNYRQLRAALREEGHVFYTESDTEVIVHLYEQYRRDCVSMLEGMFSFALWDCRERELFIARDRFGMKPLYYSLCPRGIVFASELKSILAFPGISRQPDMLAVDQYLSFGYVPSPRSIFRHVSKLPAAHTISFKDGDTSVGRYWNGGFPSASLPENDERDAAGVLLQRLSSSVREHLCADVPVGVFLSGGIDSSLIAALARVFYGKELKTFSIGFSDRSFDETRFSRLMSRFLHTRHYHQTFTPRWLRDHFREAASYLDEPFADPSYFPTFLLSRVARNEVKVALSGDGGDELFAGYPTYLAHKGADLFRSLPAALRWAAERWAERLPVSLKNFSFDFCAKLFMSGYALPLLSRHSAWMSSFSSDEKSRLYAQGGCDQKPAGPDVVFRDVLDGMPAGGDLDLLQNADIRTYLQDDILFKADRAAMANSLEVRLPFLDRGLAEYVFSLPPRLRLNGFTGKYILKRAAASLLPAGVIRRRKKGFGVPVGSWVCGELRGLALELLSEETVRRRGLFSYAYIRDILEQHFCRKADNRRKIWTLIMFELWAQNYL